MRGQQSSIGDERVAPNGYHYVRTKEGWRLKHHVAVETRLGRHLRKDEMVYFIDGDKTNFDPANLRVKVKGVRPLNTRIAQLQALIADKQAELDVLLEEQANAPKLTQRSRSQG
jgi:HNH endonuclease